MTVNLCYVLIGLFAAGAMAVTNASEPVSIQRDNTGKPIPRYANGFSVFFEREVPIVAAYDRNGTLKTQARLELPEAERLFIADVSATRSGRLAVAVSLVSRDERQIASAIFWIAADGRVEKVVRCTPFFPTKLHFTESGHLWALGMVKDGELRETDSHDLLREYDERAALVRTALPRSVFAKSRIHPAARAFLVSRGDKLGVYSETASAYVELDNSGRVLRQSTVPALPGSKVIIGVGLSSADALYLGGYERGRTSGKPLVYRFDPLSSNLKAVELPEASGAIRLQGLLGTENDELVVYGKPSALVRIPVIP